ncbi:hypothetical protein BH11ACT8_BH11ACT8_01500 [soil metagenome]
MSTMTLHLPVLPDDVATVRQIDGSSYRLTRRGRLVVFAIGLLVVLALGLVFAGGSVATRDAETTDTIVVGAGDTLWDIAADLSDNGDVRDMMRHIQQLNSLDTVDLAAGQHLRVPAE